MLDQIRGFLASQSSGSSCPFNSLDAVGPAVGLTGPVVMSYSAGQYTGLAGLVSELYVLLPRLGLSGMCNQLRVSRGVATAGVSVKASNHSPLGCSGITNGVRVVTGCLMTQ